MASYQKYMCSLQLSAAGLASWLACQPPGWRPWLTSSMKVMCVCAQCGMLKAAALKTLARKHELSVSTDLQWPTAMWLAESLSHQ